MRKYIYILFLLFIISCDESSDIITKSIEISDFDQICVDDIFDVVLIQDTVCKIEIIAESNLIPGLKFNVDENKILNISNKNTARWTSNYIKPILNISVDTLWFLRLNSPSTIVTQNTLLTPELKIYSIAEYAEYNIDVICNNCYVVSSGTSGGTLKISGTANTFTFWARASFQVYAEEFNANYVNVKTESIADCSINVHNELLVEILSEGYIFYKGDPYKIEYLNEKAKEQLIKLD
jgi:Putative auto-transporter adhesin, head GIN domain